MSLFIDRHNRRKSPLTLAAFGAALLYLCIYGVLYALLAELPAAPTAPPPEEEALFGPESGGGPSSFRSEEEEAPLYGRR